MKIKKILVSQPKPSSEKSPYYDIAEKYGGILKTDVADNWFETSVIMYEK